MLLYFCEALVCNRADGGEVGDASVRDDDVEVGDVVFGLERVDYGGCVSREGAVELEDDELAGGASGEGGEGLGGGVSRVAVGGDDGGVGFGQVGF